jgi:carbon-monoxide dehydrogenase iron sulfur subunit
MPVRIDDEKCSGCRTCEIACSLHHSGTFAPALSSIAITRFNTTGRSVATVSTTCDGCTGEPQTLCTQFCQYGAIVMDGAL